MLWQESHRADKRALPLADRHYSRQKIGSPQFVPPGRCKVFLGADERSLWVTSWPFAAYVKHAWAGAWVNSLFRNEGPQRASDLIKEALLYSMYFWNDPPELGVITFVDSRFVKPTIVRGEKVYGYCYMKAGFSHVGFTKGGLWAWQMDRLALFKLIPP
jgi:hypothetical protein